MNLTGREESAVASAECRQNTIASALDYHHEPILEEYDEADGVCGHSTRQSNTHKPVSEMVGAKFNLSCISACVVARAQLHGRDPPSLARTATVTQDP